MREREQEQLPAWVVGALQRSVSSAASRRSAIMDRVRREPSPRVLSAPMRASRWSRRGLLTPFGGATMAALLMAALALRGVELRGRGEPFESSVLVLRDSVVPVREGAHPDSLRERLLDTMRVVEFVLHGASVRSASVVGDFNAWQRGATALARDTNGDWRARVLVPRDVVQYAYVVNDAQVVPARPVRGAFMGVPAALRTTPDSI